jgi:signal transduction histidine kinase
LGGRWLDRRLRAVPPAAWDGLLAVLVGTIDLTLFSSFFATEATQLEQGHVVAKGILVVAGLPAAVLVALRRRWPVATCLLLCLHAAVLPALVGSAPTFTVLVGLYTVAAWRPRPAASWCLAAALAAAGSIAVDSVPRSAGEEQLPTIIGVSVFYLALDTAAWAAGRWINAHRRHARDLERRRAEATVAATEAVTAERVRLARELHDIVAHSVTVMVLQAAGARRLLETDPDAARAALGLVQDAGKQTMAELRRLLGVLRAAVPDGQDIIEPQPGLARLETLVTEVRRAGVEVQVEVVGEASRLDPSVEVAAFRTLQEALTNATRHAGPGATAHVRLHWVDRGLVIEVTDDGAGRPDPTTSGLSTGHGLVGLRERVTIVGGRLEAGPVAIGGFRIVVALPKTGTDAPPPLVGRPVQPAPPDRPAGRQA